MTVNEGGKTEKHHGETIRNKTATDKEGRGRREGGGRERSMDGWRGVRRREERPAWTRLQFHQLEQLVWQQDDCHRCLPTSATLASTCHSTRRLF